MADKNAGSIASDIFNSISPISSNLSGLLLTFVENQIAYVNQFTGTTFTSGGLITSTYVPAVTNLATSQVVQLMSVQDGGAKSASIGDLSIDNSNLSSMAKHYYDLGQLQLMQLTRGLKFFKSRG